MQIKFINIESAKHSMVEEEKKQKPLTTKELQ
jgi:hypothetical protein